MKIYNYHPISGEFLSVSIADQDPLSPDDWLIPAHATPIEPLPVKSGFAVCFKAGDWEYKTDSRGVWFKTDGTQIDVYSLDDIIGTSWTRSTPQPTIEKLTELKRIEINTAFEQSMQQITNGYPASETSSWAKQETEARAYVADNAASTPLIDALTATRGVAKADLVSRIIAKADLFATVSGQFIGKRQGLEDALDALPETATAEEIAAISW